MSTTTGGVQLHPAGNRGAAQVYSSTDAATDIATKQAEAIAAGLPSE
jgi:hypothetical protein